MKQVMVRVVGRVQGVFFRQSTKSLADDLGISGWVRNCSDGSVEACLEGNGRDLALIINWLQEGPELADVELVQLISEKVCTNLSEGFTIKV
jgi:acylphosphatase